MNDQGPEERVGYKRGGKRRKGFYIIAYSLSGTHEKANENLLAG